MITIRTNIKDPAKALELLSTYRDLIYKTETVKGQKICVWLDLGKLLDLLRTDRESWEYMKDFHFQTSGTGQPVSLCPLGCPVFMVHSKAWCFGHQVIIDTAGRVLLEVRNPANPGLKVYSGAVAMAETLVKMIYDDKSYN